jgi:DNA-binding transcriptional LysR family regulator
MLDAVSLDQQRTFIAAVEGSFSAASGKLLRSQSVASETISNLVDQIGVPLLDRSGRYPKLPPAAGVVLLADARSIVTGVDLLKARAKGMSVGLEPELSVVIDVFYLIEAITQVAKEFRQHYPGVPLRI